MKEEVEIYAGIIHGRQAIDYWMAYLYHRRRKQTVYKWISLAGIAFHAWAAYEHFKDKK